MFRFKYLQNTAQVYNSTDFHTILNNFSKKTQQIEIIF